MHIGINILFFKVNLNGMSTYALHLVREINRLNPDHCFTLFLPSHAKGIFPESWNIRHKYIPVPNLPVRIFAEQFLLPAAVLGSKCDILHNLANVVPVILGTKNIVTIHDIYYVHYPQRFNILKLTYLRIIVRFAAFFSKRVIAVSQSTRDDLVNYGYISNRDKVNVIYEGVEMTKQLPAGGSDQTLDYYGIRKPYFLFVSCIEPGKNLLNLIKAVADFDRRYMLAVAGAWGWGYENILEYLKNNKEVKERIVFTDYIPEKDLAALYSAASALIMPSFQEGFGLPVIEAMYFKCPVCCSNRPSLPEIAGDAALMFDPDNPDEIKSSLEKVLDDEVSKILIEKGNSNLKRFSWGKCARETLEIYNDVEKERSR